MSEPIILMKQEEPLYPLQAIRKKCLDCVGGSITEVRYCQTVNCPLFSYRFGKRPQTALRDEQKVHQVEVVK